MIAKNLQHGIASLAMVALLSVAAGAEEWGNLKGKFVYDGPAPEPKAFDTSKEAVCGQHKVVDESLLVGPDGGLKDVLIFVRSKGVKAHPDYAKDANGEAVLDNNGCRFQPHILPMLATQTLVIKNSDPVSHNSNVTEPGGAGTNPIIQPGSQATYKFGKAAPRVSPVNCNIHPWMQAYVIPRDNPYFAVTKEDGTFEIKNLPVGEWEFQVWQDRAGNFKDDKDHGWDGGKFKLKIKPGDNDLGTIKLKPALFPKK